MKTANPKQYPRLANPTGMDFKKHSICVKESRVLKGAKDISIQILKKVLMISYFYFIEFLITTKLFNKLRKSKENKNSE